MAKDGFKYVGDATEGCSIYFGHSFWAATIAAGQESMIGTMEILHEIQFGSVLHNYFIKRFIPG